MRKLEVLMECGKCGGVLLYSKYMYLNGDTCSDCHKLKKALLKKRIRED